MGTVVSVSYGNEVSPDTMEGTTKKLFDIFDRYDKEFSTYRPDSMVSQVNAGLKEPLAITDEALDIFTLAETYREMTDGYFDIIDPSGRTDPSGIVKSYAIREAGKHLEKTDIDNWCLNAGGDILTSGAYGWRAGITDPNRRGALVSDILLQGEFRSLATSGFLERGFHIWNTKENLNSDVMQASVTSADIIFSDVMATALVSAGSKGLSWVETKERAEALLIMRDGSFRVTDGYLSLVS